VFSTASLKNKLKLLIPLYISIRVYKIKKISQITLIDIFNFIDRNFLSYTIAGFFSIAVYKVYVTASFQELFSLLMIYFVANVLLYLIYEIGYVFNEYMAYKEKPEHRSIKISEKPFTKDILALTTLSRAGYYLVTVWLLTSLKIIPEGILKSILLVNLTLLITFLIHNIIPVEYRIRSSYPILKTLKSLSVLYPISFDQHSKIFAMTFSLSLGIIENVYYTLKKHGVAHLYFEPHRLRFISVSLSTFLMQLYIGMFLFNQLDITVIGGFSALVCVRLHTTFSSLHL